MARPRNEPAMAVDALERIVMALGGVRATARALGCAPSTVARYLAGDAVPRAVAVRLELALFDARLQGFTDQAGGP